MLNIIRTHYASMDEKEDDYSEDDTDEEKPNRIKSAPYVISPDECGEEIGYAISELTYFINDDILVDDFGEIVEYPDELVGCDFMKHFGEYEEDSVFVRNETLMCDFEILKDIGTYSGEY